MDTDEYLAAAERDGKLIDAIHRGLYAMSLMNGCAVTIEGKSFTQNFDHEIVKLAEALKLLGVDPNEPLSMPIDGRDPLN